MKLSIRETWISYLKIHFNRGVLDITSRANKTRKNSKNIYTHPDEEHVDIRMINLENKETELDFFRQQQTFLKKDAYVITIFFCLTEKRPINDKQWVGYWQKIERRYIKRKSDSPYKKLSSKLNSAVYYGFLLRIFLNIHKFASNFTVCWKELIDQNLPYADARYSSEGGYDPITKMEAYMLKITT